MENIIEIIMMMALGTLYVGVMGYDLIRKIYIAVFINLAVTAACWWVVGWINLSTDLWIIGNVTILTLLLFFGISLVFEGINRMSNSERS